MNLYLLRHQKTIFNSKGILQGSDNSKSIIIDSDYIQTVESNKGLLNKNNITKVYTSPQKRAIQTVNSYKFESFIVDDRIVEYDFGVWEGKLKEVMMSECSYEWNDKFTQFSYGEGFQLLSERVNNFLHDIKNQKDNNILIVSHGLVLRYIYCLLNGLDLNKLNQIEILNNKIYEVKI